MYCSSQNCSIAPTYSLSSASGFQGFSKLPGFVAADMMGDDTSYINPQKITLLISLLLKALLLELGNNNGHIAPEQKALIVLVQAGAYTGLWTWSCRTINDTLSFYPVLLLGY